MKKLIETWEQYKIKQETRQLRGYLIAFLALTLFLIACLCANASELAIQTIAYEASGEKTFEGKVFVASVIKQRMKERNLTAEQVVLQKAQFSCWKDGKATQKRTLTAQELETARQAWNQATAQGWNHYCRYDVKPYWIKKAKKSVRIGSHVFYVL